MKYFRGIILLFLFGLMFACDAPKLNPLDPQNPDYHMTTIDGTIKKAAGVQDPISGVKVLWKNQNIIVETNASGYFKIDEVPLQNGIIVFEKEGFSKDSVSVNFESQRTPHLEIFLNAIPKLENLSIYTSVLNRYPDQQNDSLFVKAKVSDAENEIDSVFVRCTELSIYKKLSLNSTSGFYENKFSPDDLGLNFLDEGIGKDFEIIVVDHSKKIYNVGFSAIKRVIRKDIIFRSPANLNTVATPITFIWYRFLPVFNFKYMFEIYTNTLPAVLVRQWTNISKEAVEFTPTIALSPGEYFWVIWAVDDFQNRARSLPASFVVQ